MPEMQLTPKERQALKASAHGLKPVVLLGNAGASGPVLKEIDRALAAHELVKVRVPGDDRAERESLFAELAETLSAARVQAIGKLLVLYRPAPDQPPASQAAAQRRRASAQKPATRPARSPAQPSKPSAPKRSTPDRRDAERVNRPPAARRDPGAAKRALGRTNVARKPGAARKRSSGR